MPSNKKGGSVSQDSHCTQTGWVRGGKWLPLHDLFLFLFPSLLNCLYLDLWVFSLLPFLFSPLANVGAQQLDGVNPPEHCTSTVQQPHTSSSSYSIAFCILFFWGLFGWGVFCGVFFVCLVLGRAFWWFVLIKNFTWAVPNFKKSQVEHLLLQPSQTPN